MSESDRVRTRAFPGLDANLGPARPLSSADSEWLIEQVVGRTLVPEQRRSRPMRLRTLWLAAIVVTSAAAATIVHQKIQRNAATTAPAVNVPQRQNKKLAPHHAPSERASDPNEDTVANSQPIASALAAQSSKVPSRDREVNPVVSAASAMMREQAVAVVDELSEANELRRKNQWQTAEAAYRAIAARYPRAPEATVALLAAAELRFEHLGDVTGALRLYQSVSRGTALGVEALFGLSRAYRALGYSEAEATALRSLIDAYPSSLQADGARARLKQIADSTHP